MQFGLYIIISFGVRLLLMLLYHFVPMMKLDFGEHPGHSIVTWIELTLDTLAVEFRTAFEVDINRR